MESRRVKIPTLNAGEEAFLHWCKVLKQPTPTRNYRFHPTRKWEIDFAWSSVRLGVEIQGGVWMKGGAHSLPSNIIRDMAKHNALLDFGWRVYYFTPDECKSGAANQKMAKVLLIRHALAPGNVGPVEIHAHGRSE